MKIYRIALSALALVLGTSAFLMAQGGPPPGPPPPDHQPYDHDRGGWDHDHGGWDHDHGGWDAPPPEFRDVQRQGFHDGIQAAHDDFANHRYPGANRRREFRHPPVPRPFRDDYRQGFSRGYDMAISHFGHGPDHY